MGCASSQVANDQQSNAPKMHKTDSTNTINNSEEQIAVTAESLKVGIKYPPAEAFEILLNDNNPEISTINSSGDKLDSLIKKHPPKRLQRLVEQSNQQQLATIENLEEKLAKAEQRRQQYLQQKIVSVVTLAQQNKNDDDQHDVVFHTKKIIQTRSPGDGDDQVDYQIT